MSAIIAECRNCDHLWYNEEAVGQFVMRCRRWPAFAIYAEDYCTSFECTVAQQSIEAATKLRHQQEQEARHANLHV